MKRLLLEAPSQVTQYHIMEQDVAYVRPRSDRGVRWVSFYSYSVVYLCFFFSCLVSFVGSSVLLLSIVLCAWYLSLSLVFDFSLSPSCAVDWASPTNSYAVQSPRSYNILQRGIFIATIQDFSIW